MGDEYWTWQPHCPVILPVRSEHANTVALAGWGVFPIQSDRSIVEVRNKRTDYGSVNPPLTTALSWGSNSSAPYTSYCNKAPSPLCLCSYWSTAAHFFMHIQQSPGWVISWLVLHTPYSATGMNIHVYDREHELLTPGPIPCWKFSHISSFRT